MEFKNDELTCRFVVPDKITVRQQMRYFSAINFKNTSDEMFWEAHWEATKPLIEDWECELMPDYKTSLDDMNDPMQAVIIIWASGEVRKYINNLESVPKN